MNIFLPALLSLSAHAAQPDPQISQALAEVKLHPDYRIEIYASDIDGARSLTLGDQGTLFVGTRGNRVFAIKDGKKYEVARGLESPNGVAFKDGALYVAEISRILKYPAIESSLSKPPKPTVIYSDLPTDGHHGWKFLRFGPDGALYTAVGAPCNVCEKKDSRYASILRFRKLDGSPPEVFAHGVRNTVGFDFHPQTRELWFTDNGRDWMGDDVPDDELNRAPKPGMHFGFPYCHAGTVADSEFKSRKCSEFIAPELKLGPHVAALGMRFLSANRIWIAQHGSWNRATRIGYQVVEVALVDGKPRAGTPIAEFLRSSGKVLGRPVDVQPLPDGSVLVSDDAQNRIYRIIKKGS